MLYCTRVAPTDSATDDTDGTAANVTLNTRAKRVLYVGGYEVQVTFTAAEGQHRSVFITGDVEYGGNVSRIPLGVSYHSAMVGGDRMVHTRVMDGFYPVDWATGPNAILTANTRGIGGTVISEADVFIVYSDGQGHPLNMSIWGGPNGLQAVPKYYIRADAFSAITGSATETAGTAITRPTKAKECVGLAPLGVTDGTITAAEELNTRVRFTATGAVAYFEPDQIWPINGGAVSAGLQGLANASVDSSPFYVDFIPLRFPIDLGGTITPNYTMRSTATGATEHYLYGAFV